MLATANAWQAISFLATSQGDFSNATAASRKCEDLARQLGDKRLIATVLAFGASSKMMSGDNSDADAVVEEVFSIALESDDPFALSVAHGMIGLNMLLKGQDIKTANEHVSKGLALLKNTPHHFWQTMMLFGLGMEADWSHLPYDFLAYISNEIINNVKGINRVVYDISSKPPATIEWE